jgi:hypothetical protein
MKRWRGRRRRVPIICSLHFCKLLIIDAAETLAEDDGLGIKKTGKRILASREERALAREHVFSNSDKPANPGPLSYQIQTISLRLLLLPHLYENISTFDFSKCLTLLRFSPLLVSCCGLGHTRQQAQRSSIVSSRTSSLKSEHCQELGSPTTYLQRITLLISTTNIH